jgi:hypothetical protein
MTPAVRNPKDFWAGVLYLVLGGSAVVLARDYEIGSALRMGPGYFPTVLGGLLALIGGIALARSFRRGGGRIEPLALKPLALVTLSMLLFGVLVRGAGLVAALIVLLLVSAAASRNFRLVPLLTWGAVLVLFCALVFIKALGVPLPIVGPWLGG